ncbi:hypothetical protein BJ138DRAFT_1156216 [Hygrophoropsis aurantiaca]|uniref:Uncharacterized protein n=1 Tax=Hygrophoropsis aurantiaca TaxID=72124 RepID=A0ACB8A6B4_9AGAM|nr:hypothetical protein BJ138DRAFT_1156216 [Hygrophoropsis aurantiaca]
MSTNNYSSSETRNQTFGDSRNTSRPTLPSVRDLFPDELSRSPRPPVSSQPPWILSNSHPNASHPHPNSAAAYASHSVNPLLGPGLQRASTSAQHRQASSRTPRPDMHPTAPTFFKPNQEIQSPSLSRSNSSHQPGAYRSSGEMGQRGPNYEYPPQQRSTTSHPFQQHEYPRGQYPSQPAAGPSSGGPYQLGQARFPEVPSQHHHRDSQELASGSVVPSGVPTYPSPVIASSALKYECDYCGKGFSRPSSLKIHLNSHTGEKPFLCTFEGCGRSFSVLSNMRRHARVHAPAGQNDASSDEMSDTHSRSGH